MDKETTLRQWNTTRETREVITVNNYKDGGLFLYWTRINGTDAKSDIIHLTEAEKQQLRQILNEEKGE